MSISTDVSRIKGNIASALAAIADKGVTVPDGSTSDALAGLIASIEAGGGGLEYNRLKSCASGSFTVAERTQISSDAPYLLQHGAGVIPILIQIYASSGNSQSDLLCLFCWREKHWNTSIYNPQLHSISARRYNASYAIFSQETIEQGIATGESWTEESAKVYQHRTTMYFNAGITYNWEVYTIE